MRKFKAYPIEEYLKFVKAKSINRKITEIHLHHTWKPTKQQYLQAENKEKVILGMYNYHISLGWIDIAQHATISPDGFIWNGRDINLEPASIKGHNENAFSIEILGNFDIPGTGEYNDMGYDELEGLQLQATIELIKGLSEIFDTDRLVFHNEYSEKTCPGTRIEKEAFLKMLKPHWAEKYFVSLNKKGIVIHEKRFDDPLTRGEFFAVLDQYLKPY
ncbi:N-acetylmuramoyl-L-alanine amidase [Lutibacter sp. B2]|nr:N-acetylmuramoyl-L-alanine amidase [Lutibacter sp. B2]